MSACNLCGRWIVPEEAACYSAIDGGSVHVQCLEAADLEVNVAHQSACQQAARLCPHGHPRSECEGCAYVDAFESALPPQPW